MQDIYKAARIIHEHIAFIYEHEESFLDKFGCRGWWTLTEVSLSDDHIHFVYVLNDGQHVAAAISLDKYLEWVKGVKRSEDQRRTEAGPLQAP